MIGFGCYRISHKIEEHREALKEALLSGCTLIDTSTNYTDGSSEQCVGEMIEAFEDKKADLTVISKVGYVQGSNLIEAKEREKVGNGYPEMVKYMEGCWHCIHPVFIEQQLDNSLSRLKGHLTSYLLHNPEYFLMEQIQNATAITDLEDVREDYYQRIYQAFCHLEIEVKKGRIKSYGVSSNTFGIEDTHPHYSSLTEMVTLAKKAGEEIHGAGAKHHFTYAQLPGNLFESGFVSILEFAKQHEIKILLNRPINAIVHNSLIRLADFKLDPHSLNLDVLISELKDLEKAFEEEIAVYLKTDEGTVSPKELFPWGTELSKPELKKIGFEQWEDVEFDVIRSQVYSLVDYMNEVVTGNLKQVWEKWYHMYLHALEDCLLSFRNLSKKNSMVMSEKITQKLDAVIPESWKKESLSRKALAVLLNTEGVYGVLNGMRKKDYVKDSLGALTLERFQVTPTFYEAFKLG